LQHPKAPTGDWPGLTSLREFARQTPYVEHSDTPLRGIKSQQQNLNQP